MAQVLHRLDVLPVTQPTVSLLKHRRKLKALAPTSGLASYFLHPPPDSLHQFFNGLTFKTVQCEKKQRK